MSEIVIYDEKKQDYAPIKFIKDIPNQVKIKDISRGDFIKQLIKNIVLINNLSGVKDPISDVVKTDIKEMLLMRFKTLSFDEISYAFKLERFGVLGVRIEHFGLFDAKYVCDVLEKYLKWRSMTKVEENITIQPKKQKEPSDKEKLEIVMRGLEGCFDNYKKLGKIESGRLYLHDWLIEIGVIDLDQKTKDAIRKVAVENIDKRVVKSRQEHRDMKTVFDAVGNPTGTLLSEEKKLTLKHIFDKYTKFEQLKKKI